MARSTPAHAEVRTISVLGAGRVGTAIARQALRAGYEVLIASSRPPAEIEMIVDVVVPGARAVSAETAAREGDIVMLAIPLPKYRTLRPERLAGKIVVDAMNYWPPTDGVLTEVQSEPLSSTVIQRHLAGARLVRTLNHIGYHELEEDGRPAGDPERRALAVASDDAEARRVVAGVIDRLGYDPVDAGPLAAASQFEPGTAIFEGRFGRDVMERQLALR
jgi:8-hydroxy-5-deazaflavin:NADPH oxidoreductase